MLVVKDKKDSMKTIKMLKLNHFPFDIFSVTDYEGIKNFMTKFPAKEYVLRTVNKAKGKYFFVQSYDEAIELLPNFEDEFILDVSYNEYKEDIVLVGDIKVTRGFVDVVDLSARSDSEATQRNIYENPQYNMHCSLDDEKLWKVPGIAKIMSYISEHELYNLVVEFIVYDCKLGTNKENVIINELRSAY